MQSARAVRLFILIVIASIFVLSIVLPVAADDSFSVQKGFYIGLNYVYNTIGGDFNGDSVIVGPDVLLVPKVAGGDGWGISIGGRNQNTAFELGYLKSTHNVSFQGAKGKANYSMINLDGKVFLLSDTPAQPYLLLGLCFPWLIVKDGSAMKSGNTIQVGDAKFNGTGFNLGGGVAFYFYPKIALNGGIIYRSIKYNSAEGVAGISGNLESSLSGNGMSYTMGMTFTF